MMSVSGIEPFRFERGFPSVSGFREHGFAEISSELFQASANGKIKLHKIKMPLYTGK